MIPAFVDAEVLEPADVHVAQRLTALAEEDDEPNMVDHPVFFCPFCGKGVQTPAEVDAKTGNAN